MSTPNTINAEDQQRYILKGRSIDGTVYYVRGGWTNNIYDAEHLTEGNAELHKGITIGINKDANVDQIIGQLEILPMPQRVYDRLQVIEIIMEGSTKEQLAEMYVDRLSAAEFDSILQEIKDLMEENEALTTAESEGAI